MRSFIFATALGIASAACAHAQYIPGRDLLAFPIGSIAEAPALAVVAGDGFSNPATIKLVGARARVMVGALTTPADQAVAAQFGALAVALPLNTTVALSYVRASVNDLIRTESDPLSQDQIPYNANVLSLAAARRQRAHLVTGVAVRYQAGEADRDRARTIGVDAGIVADGLVGQDLRIGVSSYLWRPANGRVEHNTFHFATDLRLAGESERREARAGYGLTFAPQSAREHFLFLAGRHGIWEGRAGITRHEAFGSADWRLRLGGGLQYARYTVGVARDDAGAGLSPTYQFVLGALLP